MEQWFKKLSKIGSYTLVAGVSFLLYNVFQLNLDTEYSLMHDTLLKTSIAHADSPGDIYYPGSGGDGGDGGSGCGSGGSGDSSSSGAS